MGRGRRLLVVEDDGLTSSLLTEALRGQGFVVDCAASARAALDAVDAFDPDAALLDIDLGDGPSGMDLGYVLHRTRPHVALVFLTKRPDARTSSHEAGEPPPGAGFLSKDRVSDIEYLVQAIDAALHDRADEVHHDRDPDRPLAALTPKQLEVLRLMALGYTNDRIADEQGVTRSSVERWAKEIFQALGIPTSGDLNPRVEATRRFIDAHGMPSR